MDVSDDALSFSSQCDTVVKKIIILSLNKARGHSLNKECPLLHDKLQSKDNRKYITDIRSVFPFPISDFRKIFAIFCNILLVFNKLGAHFLVQMTAAIPKLRQIFQRLDNEMESVDVILDTNIK